MSIRQTTTLAVFCWALVSSCRAPTCLSEDISPASSAVLNLREVLDIAKRENPEIRAAWERWQASRARITQESYPEKPRFDLERMYAPRSSEFFSDAEEKNWAITQEIPFPTKFVLRGNVAEKEASMLEATVEAKELEILSRVKTAYAMLFLSRHTIHIFEENADLMRRFSKITETKYAAGKAPQGAALKAQVELSKMLNTLVTLHQEEETNRAMLNTLLNRPPDSPLGIPEDPHPTAIMLRYDEVAELALRRRPDLKEAKFSLEKSESALSLSRSDYLPDIMLQYRQRDVRGARDSQDVIIGFSFPLWFQKQGAGVKEAEANLKMARAEYQTLKNMTLFDVKNLYVKVQTAFRLIELYRTSVLPQAEQALQVGDAGYQADKMTFIDLLDAVRSLLNFRMEYYQYLADYEQFLAELERVVGIDLQEKSG